MKKFLLIFSIIIFGCSFPIGLTFGTPTPIPTPTETPSPTQTPLIPPEYGSEQNPLILALAPSPRPSEETIKIGEIIAAFIQAQTGYHIVTVIPTSEQMLVESGAELASEVLVLPHHGSKTSSTPAFLERVRPELGIVSAGYRNRFGHPHPKVAQRYQSAGIALDSTVAGGTLTYQWSGTGELTREQWRGLGHYWHNSP